MQRYINNKFWAMKPSDDGQYVAYHEAQETIDRLRADRDRHRADNKLLWDQIADLKEELKQKGVTVSRYREDSYDMSILMANLHDQINTWKQVCKLSWGLLAITLIITAVVLSGGV